MNPLFSLIARHGYLAITCAVFLEAVGLPVPASLALIGAGAAAASSALRVPQVLLFATAAMVAGDSLLFTFGRYTGWALLGFLCRISANPETCILRSAESFYKRGKITLLIAKFVPGVNTMAPPLAGSMKMRFSQFIRFDVAGALLYVSAYFFIGYIFRDFLAAITRGFLAAGHIVETILLLGFIAYVLHRIWLYRKYAVYRVVPRVQVAEIAQRVACGDKDRILVVDVRSHGYYDSGAWRIAGSLRIEPNNITEEIRRLPRDKDIYVYCT
jgi:membrane protein DedA with SNARE-associated domain